MDETARKIGFVSGVSAFIGALLTLAAALQFGLGWWLAPLGAAAFGGLAYLGYGWHEAGAALWHAWRAAVRWRPADHFWQGVVISGWVVTVFCCGALIAVSLTFGLAQRLSVSPAYLIFCQVFTLTTVYFLWGCYLAAQLLLDKPRLCSADWRLLAAVLNPLTAPVLAVVMNSVFLPTLAVVGAMILVVAGLATSLGVVWLLAYGLPRLFICRPGFTIDLCRKMTIGRRSSEIFWNIWRLSEVGVF